ncbi:MAG: MotA/TolQ/ExbB proton channel family protein [Gammaproteobacteria bacterium]|nr:MotA/TolQ/ExbB proton channel family protein [Gammaproteobacteria bacterium]
MHMFDTIVAFFQDGGAFMYPILLVLALGLAIAIERWLFLRQTQTANQRLWTALAPVIAEGDSRRALEMTEGDGSVLARILAYGLERLPTAEHREEIETAMEEGLMEVMPRLEKRTHYLALFANIATLLGLLGTIIGLIRAFTAVASADPAAKADMLSASISVAMNTTAFGLIVAIPLLMVHAFLQTQTTDIIDRLEMKAVKFLNASSWSLKGGARG